MSLSPDDASLTDVIVRGEVTGFARPRPSPTPMLVHSWGETLHLLRVSESKTVQTVKDAKTSKTIKVEGDWSEAMSSSSRRFVHESGLRSPSLAAGAFAPETHKDDLM